MNPDQSVPPFRWFQRRSDSLSAAWAEQLTRAFEAMYEPPTILHFSEVLDPLSFGVTECSGEPTIPSVPWEPSPIDELFLKTIGVSLE